MTDRFVQHHVRRIGRRLRLAETRCSPHKIAAITRHARSRATPIRLTAKNRARSDGKGETGTSCIKLTRGLTQIGKVLEKSAGGSEVAPRAGFEPATNRLTAGCSTAELPGNTRATSNKRGGRLQSVNRRRRAPLAKRRQPRTALLLFLYARRARGRVRNSGVVGRPKLGHAAGEIAQMQPQLVERKAEGEDALGSLVRQGSGEAFAP